MAKATLNPNLQAIADKFFDETKIVREIALLGIQQGKFTREDLLKALREWRFPPPPPEALPALFKPTPAQPKPPHPKPPAPHQRGAKNQKLYKPRTSKRTTILKIVKFNRQGRYQ